MLLQQARDVCTGPECDHRHGEVTQFVRIFTDYPLEELRGYIDWQPFFNTWEMRGRFPDILNNPATAEAARRLYDIEVYADESRRSVRATLHQLRQQTEGRDGSARKSLADFVAPKSTGLRDYIGAFAVTAGLGSADKIAEYKKANDDYSAILLEALADRLAEAFAERLHERVRREFWAYAPDEIFDNPGLIAEKYHGIRPAPGYPACPEHTEKQTLWQLLDVEKNTGIELTESMAMWPGASVSGLYFAHPQSQYFVVGRVGRDQVEEYAKRKGWTVAEAEKWLSPNLGYRTEDE
jgi:5-methyltetrahydrofolate--homocysteine methyltransferase